jgi:hypothetical protein
MQTSGGHGTPSSFLYIFVAWHLHAMKTWRFRSCEMLHHVDCWVVVGSTVPWKRQWLLTSWCSVTFVYTCTFINTAMRTLHLRRKTLSIDAFCRSLNTCLITAVVVMHWLAYRIFFFKENKYNSAPISASNTFQDLPQLRETADNTKHYICRDIRVTYINTVKFNW